jgi:hypothetical protein
MTMRCPVLRALVGTLGLLTQKVECRGLAHLVPHTIILPPSSSSSVSYKIQQHTMEATAAIGVASGALAFAEASYKFISVLCSIRENNQISGYDELAKITLEIERVFPGDP